MAVNMANVIEAAEVIDAMAQAIWLKCPRMTGAQWARVSRDDKAVYRAMAVDALKAFRNHPKAL